MRSGIGFSARGDIGMTDAGLQRETPSQCGNQRVQRRVLCCGERTVVVSLKLDAERKIIAAFMPLATRHTRMPRTIQARNELDQMTIAPDEEVRGNPAVGNGGEVGMRRRVEAVGEEIGHGCSAKLARWQADGMDDEQAGSLARGPGIMIRTRDPLDSMQPAVVIHHADSTRFLRLRVH